MMKKTTKKAAPKAVKKTAAKKVAKATVKKAAAPKAVSMPHLTLNDTANKATICDLLNLLLSGFLDLALMTKQAHWNMRGSNFISVHEMLDPFNDELLDFADQIAERIVQLGGIAYGTSQAITANTKMTAYPLNVSTTSNHLAILADRYADVANAVRQVVEGGMADEGTLNILTDASNDLDKWLWFIEAHIVA